MVNRRVFLAAVAVASGASVVAALFGETDLAVGALAIALLAMFAWIVLWAQTVNTSLARLAKSNVALTELASGGTASRREAADLRKTLHQVLHILERTPSVTAELQRLYGRVVDHQRPMPELGDWAMTASTLVWILDRIESGEVSTILECGSGSSTVWFAAALEQRGGEGRVVSLESSAEYAAETRARIAELNLEHRAEVLHAPLVPTTVGTRAEQPWFDRSVVPADLTDIDLLFVDGPVGTIARQIRYPALPLLGDRVATGKYVVLDDTGRTHEKAIVKTWSSEPVGDRSVQVVRQLDRATVFVVRPAAD